MRVLSGIQPTGPIHWGNYFGAIRQYIALQDNEQAFYFIANLHALTTVRDREAAAVDVRHRARSARARPRSEQGHAVRAVRRARSQRALLASDDRRADGPARALPSPTKTRKRKGCTADAGLFTYPVLMAADILAYDSDTVPVGDDQVQHIEVCRDLAGSFNHQFGDVFVMPKAYVLDDSARVPGTDGEKMSKSYNNTLAVFEDAKAQRKQIMRIVTDSRPMDQPKEPAGDVLYDLYSLVASDSRPRVDGRPLPPRRLWLRRNQKSTRRRRRKILGRTPCPPRRTRRPPRPHPRNPRRWSSNSTQEGSRSPKARHKVRAALHEAESRRTP